MDIAKHENEIAQIEMANFILLSLYREYSIALLKRPSDKKIYINRMRQIKYDIKHLSSKELLHKVRTLYKPILQKIEHRNLI